MNMLGSGREVAENKLILLYILDRAAMSINSLQIIKIIMENRLMNYFLLQQLLSELVEQKMLTTETIENKTFYRITESGSNTLQYFISMIPYGIKAAVDKAISELKSQIKNEMNIKAELVPESENQFNVELSVNEESFPLINIKLAVGTRKDARLICSNWEKYSHEIYAEIIESLTKNRD